MPYIDHCPACNSELLLVEGVAEFSCPICQAIIEVEAPAPKPKTPPPRIVIHPPATENPSPHRRPQMSFAESGDNGLPEPVSVPAPAPIQNLKVAKPVNVDILSGLNLKQQVPIRPLPAPTVNAPLPAPAVHSPPPTRTMKQDLDITRTDNGRIRIKLTPQTESGAMYEEDRTSFVDTSDTVGIDTKETMRIAEEIHRQTMEAMEKELDAAIHESDLQAEREGQAAARRAEEEIQQRARNDAERLMAEARAAAAEERRKANSDARRIAEDALRRAEADAAQISENARIRAEAARASAIAEAEMLREQAREQMIAIARKKALYEAKERLLTELRSKQVAVSTAGDHSDFAMEAADLAAETQKLAAPAPPPEVRPAAEIDSPQAGGEVKNMAEKAVGEKLPADTRTSQSSRRIIRSHKPTGATASRKFRIRRAGTADDGGTGEVEADTETGENDAVTPPSLTQSPAIQGPTQPSETATSREKALREARARAIEQKKRELLEAKKREFMEKRRAGGTGS